MMTQLRFHSGAAFWHWITGLIVMLLNIFNVIRTNRLIAILLFEFDIKFTNKLHLFWYKIDEKSVKLRSNTTLITWGQVRTCINLGISTQKSFI